MSLEKSLAKVTKIKEELVLFKKNQSELVRDLNNNIRVLKESLIDSEESLRSVRREK